MVPISKPEEPQADSPIKESARSMLRVLTWVDGFTISMSMAVSIVLTLGYTVGAVGGWSAIFIWATACGVALLQNNLYAEMAGMFPDRSGGISVYAHEGWKRYFAPVGAVSAFGYWMGWSLSLSVTGIAFGGMVQIAFFPNTNSVITTPFGTELGFPHLVAIAAIVIAWCLNYFGVKVAAGVAKATSIVLLLGILLLVVGTFVSPLSHFDSSHLTFQGSSSPFGWKDIVVWYYITAWTTYGSEVCCSFTAEYRDPVRDTRLALRASALFFLGVYFIVPYVTVGVLGEQVIADNPVTYVSLAFENILGSYAWIGQLPIMAAFVVSMMACTADGGRSLFGMAKSGGTLRQLGRLNRFGVPGRALTTDMVVNIAVLLLLGEPIAILVASNLGYLSAHAFAIGAYVLLRRDRPDLARPLRLAKPWTWVAVVLFVGNVFVIAVGFTNPELTGYGDMTETFVGLCILMFAVVLWFYRNQIQDKKPIEWRIRD